MLLRNVELTFRHYQRTLGLSTSVGFTRPARAATKGTTKAYTITTSTDHFFDVLIVGGGVVGSALARQLQQLSPSISICLVERGKSPLATTVTTVTPTPSLSPSTPSINNNNNNNATTVDPSLIPSPRSYALSPKSLDILGHSTLERISHRVAYYDTMQVWEAQSPAVLMFTKHDLEDYYDNNNNHKLPLSPQGQPVLGAVVEDGPLVQALWQELLDTASTTPSLSSSPVQCWTDSVVTDLQVPPDASQDWIYATLQTKKPSLLSSSSSHEEKSSPTTTSRIAARLLVAADGAQSSIRQTLGLPMVGFDYGRRAFITTVRLEEESSMGQRPILQGRAYQRFLKDGPLALLPSHLPNYATVVWSTLPEHARQLQREPDLQKVVDQLNAVLQQGPQRLPSFFTLNPNAPNGLLYGLEKLLDTVQYGFTLQHWQQGGNDNNNHTGNAASFVAPPRIVAVEGPRFAFDLSCRQVRQYVAPRVALVGDAAHTMHPMAGQGLNLGLLDVHQLVHVITKAHNSGMDLATFLPDYQQHRLRHVSLALAGVHTLHSVFGTTTPAPFQHAKSLGMHVVQNFMPLKRQLAAVAAGLV